MPSSTAVWNWIERFSWIAAIVGVSGAVVAVVAFFRADPRVEAVEKRLDEVHKLFGEIRAKDIELQGKLAAFDLERQQLAKQVAALEASATASLLARTSPLETRPSLEDLKRTLDLGGSSSVASRFPSPWAVPGSKSTAISRLPPNIFDKVDTWKWAPPEVRSSFGDQLKRFDAPLAAPRFDPLPSLPAHFGDAAKEPLGAWQTAAELARRMPPLVWVMLAVWLLGAIGKAVGK